MKKNGTLNVELSRVIAALGHTDRLVICDSGLPIPHGSEVVDLALAPNIPRFLEAVRVVLEEMEIEGAIIAREMAAKNPATYRSLLGMLRNVRVTKVSHKGFKELTAGDGNVSFVRTGEATPYANVILISGVTFGVAQQ